MSLDVCIDMCIDMHIDVCIGMRIDMCIDMYGSVMHQAMCMDMGVDMWIDMCYRHVHRRVCTHVYDHLCRRAHLLACHISGLPCRLVFRRGGRRLRGCAAHDLMTMEG